MAAYDILPDSDLKLADIRDTLNKAGGNVSNDVSTAFADISIINKWNKHKPIRYPKIGTLTEEEFKGSLIDRNKGIYYGLQAITPSVYNNLHDADYQFVSFPNGGAEEPFRLGDFRGYDVNARPNLYGDFYHTVWYNKPQAFYCFVNYDYSGLNKTGIDLGELLPENVEKDISNYYPCVLIDNWAKALYNELVYDAMGKENIQTPIKYNGAYYSKFFADVENCAALKSDGTRRISLFMVKQIYGSGGTIDFREWKDITDLIQQNPAIGVPEAIGRSVEFVKFVDYAEITASVMYANEEGFAISVTFVSDPPDKQVQYTCCINSPGFGSKSIIYDPNTPINMVFIFSWKEVGLLVIPGMQEVHMRGQVTGSDGSSAYFDETFSIQTLNL